MNWTIPSQLSYHSRNRQEVGFLNLGCFQHWALTSTGSERIRFACHPLHHYTVLSVSYGIRENRVDVRTLGGIFFVQEQHRGFVQVPKRLGLTGFFVLDTAPSGVLRSRVSSIRRIPLNPLYIPPHASYLREQQLLSSNCILSIIKNMNSTSFHVTGRLLSNIIIIAILGIGVSLT
jgi:hypothetical protein